MVRERYLHRLNTSQLDDQHIDHLQQGKPALLVLDMQDYFLDHRSHAYVPSAPDLIPVVARLAENFRTLGLPVIFTRHVNTAENAGMMAHRWKELITEDHPLRGISDAFETSRDSVITKSQYDAFHGTELDGLLRDLRVNSLVVTGVMTDVCCETTLRSGFVHGYRTIMPVDATATMNMELHMASVTSLSYGFFHPTSARAVTKMVKRG